MNNWTNNWNNRVIKFTEYCLQEKHKFKTALDKSFQCQASVLQDILSLTRNTDFGKQHNLCRVTDIKSLQRNVPIRSYDQLFPWISAEVQKKGGVVSNSPLIRWLKTSGSSGEPKKIPYTEHWMRNYRVPALGVLWATYLEYAPDLLSHPFATLDTQTVHESVNENLNGIPYQGITNRYPLINEHDWLPPWYNAPWFSAEIPEGYDNRMYCRLRYFIEQDLRVIAAINPSTLIALKFHLIKNLAELIRDVHDGTLFGKKLFNPNPMLANTLNQIDTPESITLTQLWTNLSLITCWTAASAKLYQNQLDAIFPGVKKLPFMTCGTEGVVTLPIDGHETTGPLAINQGIYEFLPASVDIEKYLEKETLVETLAFHELELNEEYHLIMTQANGLYRLAVGDIYKVIDFYKDVPRIEFCRRHGTFFSFTGEKITEPQLLSAIQNSIRQFGLSIGLFMCFPVWDEPPYYKIVAEIASQHRTQENVHQLANGIDRELCLLNEEYASKRGSLRLQPIKISFIKEGTINNYLERQKKVGNSIQLKYKPFQTDTKIYDELLVVE